MQYLTLHAGQKNCVNIIKAQMKCVANIKSLKIAVHLFEAT